MPIHDRPFVVCAETDVEISDGSLTGYVLPTTAPGARLPSILLADGSALFDRLGPWFTLIAFNATPAAELVAAAGGSECRLRWYASISPASSKFIASRSC